MKNKRILLTLTIVMLTFIAKGQTLTVNGFAYENGCGFTGPPNGFAIANVNGGNAPYTYQWSTGEVHVLSDLQDTIFGLAGGIYTVTVTDDASATATASVSIWDAPTLDYWINFVTLPCPGASNGTLILSTYANCMPSPYTFFLQNNTTGQSWGPHSLGCTVITPLCHGVDTFKNLPAGSYFATLTNAQGCTGTLAVNMPELSPPVLSASVTSSPACGNTASGKIITHINWNSFTTASNSFSGGSNSFVAVWNTLNVSLHTSGGMLITNHTNYWDSVFTNISPGNYEIRVAASGFYGALCINSYPVSVGMNTIPSAVINPSGPLIFCSGGSVQLSAPSGANKTYQWKKGGVDIPGATLSSYTAAIGGTYKVTVTNAVTGCSKTTTTGTVVTVNPAPSATITPQGPTTFCAGGSVLLKGNSGTGLTYQWKKGGNDIAGATTKNYTATIAGTYKIKVTNSYGCAKLSTGVTVTVPCKEGSEEQGSSPALNVSVFPNPANSEINILLSSDDNFEIEIVNTLGERIIKVKNKNRIDISNLTGGIYFIKVFCRNASVTEKFIKQ